MEASALIAVLLEPNDDELWVRGSDVRGDDRDFPGIDDAEARRPRAGRGNGYNSAAVRGNRVGRREDLIGRKKWRREEGIIHLPVERYDPVGGNHPRGVADVGFGREQRAKRKHPRDG